MVVEDVDVVEVDVVLDVVGVVTENVFESTSSWLPEPQVEPDRHAGHSHDLERERTVADVETDAPGRPSNVPEE